MDGQPGCIGGLCLKPLIPEYPLCDTIWSNAFTQAGFAGQYVDLREYFKAATTNIGAMTDCENGLETAWAEDSSCIMDIVHGFTSPPLPAI